MLYVGHINSAILATSWLLGGRCISLWSSATWSSSIVCDVSSPVGTTFQKSIFLDTFTGLTGVENDFVESCSVANVRFLLSYVLTCLNLFLIDSNQDPLKLKDIINICNCRVKVKVNLCLSVIVYYFPITNLYHMYPTMQVVVVHTRPWKLKVLYLSAS